MAHAGYYSNKFKTYIAPNPGKYLKSGAVYKTEAGGIAVGTHGVVYTGHGVAPDNVLLITARAMIKAVYYKYGHQMSSWQEPVWNVLIRPPTAATTIHTISLHYKIGEMALQQVQTVPVTDHMTYAEVAAGLATAMQNAFSGIAVNERPEYTQLSLRDQDASNANAPIKINLVGAMIDWAFKSHMMLQNRTGASEADSAVTDRVDANPIHGYIYEGYGNGFRLYTPGNPNTAGPAFQLVTSGNFGLIEFDVNNLSGQDRLIYQRPPSNKRAFATTQKMGRAMLQPGQIRRGQLSYGKKILLDQLVQMVYTGNSLKTHFPLGKSQLYGFDKVVRAPSETSGIEVAWEINQVYGAKLITKNVVCLPDVSIF